MQCSFKGDKLKLQTKPHANVDSPVTSCKFIISLPIIKSIEFDIEKNHKCQLLRIRFQSRLNETWYLSGHYSIDLRLNVLLCIAATFTMCEEQAFYAYS